MPKNPRHTIATALVLLLTVGLANWAAAGEGRCHHCGCECECQKVCRLVDEEKKVTINCWGCLSEDFCLPGHSHRGCRHCEEVCDTCDEPCDSKTPQAGPKKFVWYDWCPGCSKGIHTKKKLMKKTITKKIPSYKWVVEELCDECEGKCQCVMVEPGANVPAAPLADVKLKYGVRLFSTEAPESAVESKTESIVPVSMQGQTSMFQSIFGKR